MIEEEHPRDIWTEFDFYKNQEFVVSFAKYYVWTFCIVTVKRLQVESDDHLLPRASRRIFEIFIVV